MTKSEIIKKTLEDMRGKYPPEHNDAEGGSEESLVDYDLSITVPTLMERLPDGDTKTCADFRHLGVECCDSCHFFYAHYDMCLEDIPEGGKAWICCSVRRALRGEPPVQKSDEDVDLEEALGDGIRERERSADADKPEE